MVAASRRNLGFANEVICVTQVYTSVYEETTGQRFLPQLGQQKSLDSSEYAKNSGFVQPLPGFSVQTASRNISFANRKSGTPMTLFQPWAARLSPIQNSNDTRSHPLCASVFAGNWNLVTGNFTRVAAAVFFAVDIGEGGIGGIGNGLKAVVDASLKVKMFGHFAILACKRFPPRLEKPSVHSSLCTVLKLVISTGLTSSISAQPLHSDTGQGLNSPGYATAFLPGR